MMLRVQTTYHNQVYSLYQLLKAGCCGLYSSFLEKMSHCSGTKRSCKGKEKKKNQTALKNVKPTSYAMTVAKIMKNVLHWAFTLGFHSDITLQFKHNSN